MKDPIEGFNEMSEIDRIEAERKLLDTAFRNSYHIITGKLTFENIIEETGQFLIAHNPDSNIKRDDLINMMGYFTETEEYEKCAKIRDIIKTNKQKKKEISTQGINKIFNKFVRRTKK
jgi:hypothetical protein